MFVTFPNLVKTNQMTVAVIACILIHANNVHTKFIVYDATKFTGTATNILTSILIFPDLPVSRVKVWLVRLHYHSWKYH